MAEIVTNNKYDHCPTWDHLLGYLMGQISSLEVLKKMPDVYTKYYSKSLQTFPLILFHQSIIAVQCCVGFCHTQSETAVCVCVCVCILPLSSLLLTTPLSHPPRSSQSAKLSSLYYTASSNQLSILNMASKVVLVVKNLPANAGDIKGPSSIPGLGRSPG